MATIIRDPLMEPFFLSKDRYSYTLLETKIATYEGKRGRRPKVTPELLKQEKTYESPIGYYTTLEGAIKKIIDLKMERKNKYNSLKSYLSEYKKVLKEISTLFEKIKI